MKGINLNKPKKIHSDKDVSIFRDKNGHEIRVAHAALSPKLRKELEAIPIHGKEPKKMARGGDSSDDYDQSVPVSIGTQPQIPNNLINPNPGSQFVQSQGPAIQQMTPEEQAQANSDYLPYGVQASDLYHPGGSQDNQQPWNEQGQNQPAPSQDNNDESGPNEEEAATPSSRAPAQENDNVPAPQQDQEQIATPQQVYSNNMENLQTEDKLFAQDLNSGHITPETYGDLYAKKSTLGKLGMIFGLMVGSAGAGLSHQNNALLGMMNTEINNDLEAQKQSKTNAQNWLKLSQQHAKNQAEIQLAQAQTATQRAMAQAQLANAEYTGQESAVTKMKYAFLHQAAMKAGALPPGPQRTQAEQMLGALSNNFQQESMARNHAVSTRIAQGYSQQPSVPGLDQVDRTGINVLEMRAQAGDPSVSMADVQNATKEMGQIQQTEMSRQNFLNSFDHLNNMTLAGKFSPQQRAAYVSQMAQDIAAGNPNIGIDRAQAALEGFMPSGKDMPGSDTRQVKMDQANRFFNEMDASTPTLDRFNLRNRKQQSQSGYGNASSGGGKAEIRYDSRGNAWTRDPRTGRVVPYRG